MKNWVAVTLILVLAISASALVYGLLNNSGYSEGYAAGNSTGYHNGLVNGNQTGYQAGWTAGNSTGYQLGLRYANNSINVQDSNLTDYQDGFEEGYSDGYLSGLRAAPYIQDGTVQFNSTELQNFESIKSRLQVTNTDPNFSGNRTLQWISMRNSTAAPWDPYQKSMEFLCFWSGQGAKGEWEAVVSIYNNFGTMNQYTVEVSRFSWHSLEISLDGNTKATFPQVTTDTTTLGYTTFQVQP